MPRAKKPDVGKKPRLHFYLDADVLDKIRQIADTEDRGLGKTANRLLRWAIHEWETTQQERQTRPPRNPFPT